MAWFALRVRSNFERVTSTILRQKGFEEFVPSYRTKRRWSDRVKEIERPLFPGYVFCRFDPNRVLPIVRTPGVVHVVGSGGSPCQIDETEMRSLRTLVASQVLMAPYRFLRLGQRVVIRHGRLAGIEGIVEAFRSGYRIVISITLLQRSVAAELEADWITPLR
jgi:transcription antitermination factor NusG